MTSVAQAWIPACAGVTHALRIPQCHSRAGGNPCLESVLSPLKLFLQTVMVYITNKNNKGRNQKACVCTPYLVPIRSNQLHGKNHCALWLMEITDHLGTHCCGKYKTRSGVPGRRRDILVGNAPLGRRTKRACSA